MTTIAPPPPAPPETPRRTLREAVTTNPVSPRWRITAAAVAVWLAAIAADKAHPLLVVAGIGAALGLALFVDTLRWPGSSLGRRLATHRTRLPYIAGPAAWLAVAGFADWQPADTLATGLTLTLAAAALGLHLWRNGWGSPTVIAVEQLAIAAEPAPDPGAAAVAAIAARWERLASHRGHLANTRLADIEPVRVPGAPPGGVSWRATIVLDDETDPDNVENGAGRVALAFKAPRDGVCITLDPFNAAIANIVVLKQNMLRETIMWDGVGIRADGSAVTGRHMSGVDMPYQFWDGTGAWNDLISGATGAGKSEYANLLLAMEIRHPLVDSYLIDVQGGQSFGELVDGLAGFAAGLPAARKLAAQIEAEMLDRNARLAAMTWTDGRGRNRRGVKTWQPTEDMHLISLTVDEAHAFLADEEFRGCIARISAMGRKCGIKVRLITQVPLLSSLGGSMEIRDAVTSGNVVVFRTANRLSGEVAASGNLPGKPHKLPRKWPNGTTAAGLCYSAGAVAVPELARGIYAGDVFDWLFSDDGVLLYPPTARPLPDPHVPEQQTTEQLTNATNGRGMTARDEVMVFMRQHPGEQISRFDVVSALTPARSVRGVAGALAQLLTPQYGALLEQPREGFYRLREGAAGDETASEL